MARCRFCGLLECSSPLREIDQGDEPRLRPSRKPPKRLWLGTRQREGTTIDLEDADRDGVWGNIIKALDEDR